jgi:Ca2+-binding RTX toxin-like protein
MLVVAWLRVKGLPPPHGDEGADIVRGGLGDDFIDGGAGTDTAIFSGLRSSYTVNFGDGFIIVTGQDGTDTLVSVEFLQFDDGTRDLSDAPTSVDGWVV